MTTTQLENLPGRAGRWSAEHMLRFWRFVVVQIFEVVLVQVADKLAMLVGSDEQYVHLVHAFANGQNRIIASIRRRCGTGETVDRRRVISWQLAKCWENKSQNR